MILKLLHRQIPSLAAVAISFVMLFSVPLRGIAQDTVTVSTGEWAPFVSESLDNYGIAPHIISEAFAQVGLNVEYQWFPWSRAMQEAEESKADFSGIWFYNDERAEKFAYTDAVVSSANVFFKRKDTDFDWNGFETFPLDKVIGRTFSYSYGQDFDNAVQAGKIIVDDAPTDILNFRKLIRGRIDAFPVGELVGFDMLKEHFTAAEVERLEVHPKRISDAPLHLISAKGNTRSAELIKQFNSGMDQLRSSGKLAQILNSYR